MRQLKKYSGVLSKVGYFAFGALVIPFVVGAVGTAFPTGSLLQPEVFTSSQIGNNTIFNPDENTSAKGWQQRYLRAGRPALSF